MLKKCLIVFAALLSVGSMSVSADTIYSEDFEGGDGGFTSSAFSNGPAGGQAGGPNMDQPTFTTGPTTGLGGTVGGLQYDTVVFDEANNPSWAGSQIISPAIPASAFSGIPLSDISLGFDFAVVADAGPASTLRFELREIGGATTHAVDVAVADLIGTESNFSFALDQNQTTGSVSDPALDRQIYVQVSDSWQLTGSNRNVNLVVDNFLIEGPDSIPEPSSFGLMMLVGMGLVSRRRR